MNTNMKGTKMDEIENEMARCMEASSIPQSSPAAARVSEIMTRYVQKFGSVRLQIFRLSGISKEALRSYLNALRITLLRKGVQPQYCWQYNPTQDAYILFLCHYDCPPGCIQQIVFRLLPGSARLRIISSVSVNQCVLPDIETWLSNVFPPIPVSPTTPFYQHTFGYSRSL
ncbi:MAG: hypothetical protein E7055_00805 [Lentisphaerae bacterium]|nr:hypothetical protein [Lentisphaerota bacterium]